MPSNRPYYFPVWESVRKPFRFMKSLEDIDLFEVCCTCDKFMSALNGFNIALHQDMNAKEYSDLNLALFYAQRGILTTKLRFANEITERSLKRMASK